MTDMSPKDTFRTRRLYTRLCFLFGVLLVGVSTAPEHLLGSPLRDIARYVGIVLLAATFPLYHFHANRCPRCRRSFSDAPRVISDDDDTRGLPLFNSISHCPFCGLVLDDKRSSSK